MIMNAGGVVLLILGIVVLIAVYWLPTWIAVARNVPAPGQVFVLNLFLGWTLVGWVVALVLAYRTPLPRSTPAVKPLAKPTSPLDGYR